MELPMDCVLTLCPIPESINRDVIKEEMTKYMDSRLGYYRYKKRTPYVEDEFSEYFTALSSGGHEIGGGHSAMDVITKDNEGIDAMCVIMNGSQSNEKSLIQNFKLAGKDLDRLFKEERDEEAVSLFMDQYEEKIKNVKESKQLTDMYILAYISTRTNIYLACFKINTSAIPNVSSGGFVKKRKNANYVNIIVDNFIDSNIGTVKLYKSKKRFELRFKKSILQQKHVCNIFNI